MKLLKRFRAPILLATVFAVVAWWHPDMASRSSTIMANYLREMILIIPPMFVLMGLLEVWAPKGKIRELLGRGSGAKGILLSLVLGTLPTGPLYVAFPLAGSLLQKGARVSNIVIFLGAWAAIKIPQLVVEAQFLGASFAVLRFLLTVAAVIVIGLFMELTLHPGLAARPKRRGLAGGETEGQPRQPEERGKKVLERISELRNLAPGPSSNRP